MSLRHVVCTVMLVLIAACRSEPRYVGVGDVLTVDAAARTVTIRHDQIADLMEASTTRFAVPADDVRAALTPGTRVRFELHRAGDELLIDRANLLSAGNPGVHDHTPHHGGIVAMAGMIHLEARANADGRVQLYLTDIWRRPLPIDGVEGTVTLDLPDGKRTLPLTAAGDALEAHAPALTQRAVNAGFALRRDGEPVEVSFLLPLAASGSGAAGIPVEGCVAPAPGAAGGIVPRCTLRFAAPVATLGSAPDGSLLLVALVDLGVSGWRLPGAQFALGLAPPPPVVIPVNEPPHPEAANAVVVRPDGREAVVALENRLIFYSLASGQVVRAFDGPGGIVRAVAWAPDGGAVVVSTFYNAAAYVLDARDGRVLGRFPVEREGAAVAWSADGRMLAVGSEVGTVALFAVGSATPQRVLRGGRGPTRALAFLGGRLLAAGDDGVLRGWDAASGMPRLERRLGPNLRAMAVNAERGVVATAGTDPGIALTAIDSGARLGTFGWHAAPISALTWAGRTLVSGDGAGRVALWNMPAAE